MNKVTYTENLQRGVTLTVEVTDPDTDVNIKDNDEFPEDRIEVLDPDTGAMSRVEVQQNEKAKGGR